MNELVGKSLEAFQILAMWALYQRVGAEKKLISLSKEREALTGIAGVMDDGTIKQEFVLTDGKDCYIINQQKLSMVVQA